MGGGAAGAARRAEAHVAAHAHNLFAPVRTRELLEYMPKSRDYDTLADRCREAEVELATAKATIFKQTDAVNHAVESERILRASSADLEHKVGASLSLSLSPSLSLAA